MCRLFGFRATRPDHVARLLLDSPSSLSTLSREHQHGWGIGYYRDADTVVHKGVDPAHADPEFERVARQIEGSCVLAHVRRRSVGEFGLANNHPFRYGRLLFAHNGTVREYERLRLQIEGAIKPRFASGLEGTTDSERCFLLFLGHLDDMGALDQPRLEDLATALARTVSQLRALPAPAAEPHLLTFLVTDGVSMAAVRAGEKELWVAREHAEDGSGLDRLYLASEPLSREDDWEPIADDRIVGIGASMRLRSWTLSGPLAKPLG